MSEAKWIVRTQVAPAAPQREGKAAAAETRVCGGWQIPSQGIWPARVEGWSIVLSIDEETSDSVSGRLVFPERAAFEFAGSRAAMVRALEKSGAERAAFRMDEFTFIRD